MFVIEHVERYLLTGRSWFQQSRIYMDLSIMMLG